MSVLHMYKPMCMVSIPMEKHQTSESLDPGFFGSHFYMLSIFKMVFHRLWLNCQLALTHTVVKLRVVRGWLTSTEHNWKITVL